MELEPTCVELLIQPGVLMYNHLATVINLVYVYRNVVACYGKHAIAAADGVARNSTFDFIDYKSQRCKQ
jgi:hypothetical protein